MARAHARRTWVVTIAVAAGVHAAAFLLLGVEPVRDSSHAPKQRGTRWMGEQTGDTVDLFDPEPLFLPTRWNAGAKLTLNLDSAEPGTVFKLFEPALSVPTGQSPDGLVSLPEGVRTAGVAIRRFSRPLFAAFGEVDARATPLPPRVAAINVCDAATGEVVLRREVSVTDLGKQAGDTPKWPLWEPFSLFVAVEPVGVLGVPLVHAPGSGVEVVDAFFRSHLQDILRPDLTLPVGYYRVLIGP